MNTNYNKQEDCINHIPINLCSVRQKCHGVCSLFKKKGTYETQIKTYGGVKHMSANEIASDKLKDDYISGKVPRIENEGTNRESDNLELLFKLESIDRTVESSSVNGNGFNNMYGEV